MGLLSRRGPLLVALLALLAAAWPTARSPAHADSKPMLIVMAASFPGKDIELAKLRRAFSATPTDLEGKRLIPINLPTGNALRGAFDKQVLGLEPSEVGPFWINKRIRDEGTPPRAVPTVDLAVRVAASLAGAITYAPAEQLNASLKALTIDGKSPSDPGYPLHL